MVFPIPDPEFTNLKAYRCAYLLNPNLKNKGKRQKPEKAAYSILSLVN